MIFLEAGFRSSNVRNTNWQDLSFAIVGLGLIGGSYAKALRILGARQIIGVDLSEATLAQAQQMGIIDLGMKAADERLSQADVVICAIYPEAIAGFIKNNVANFKPDVLITDVAGIKNNMITEVQAVLAPGMEFISGHPMAGRQSSGLGMADAAIFHNANYIIVPEKSNTEAAIQ